MKSNKLSSPKTPRRGNTAWALLVIKLLVHSGQTAGNSDPVRPDLHSSRRSATLKSVAFRPEVFQRAHHC